MTSFLDGPITQQAKEKLKLESAPAHGKFSPEIEEALRLSDVFDEIRPQAYILPLDAMAGFCVHTAESKDL